MRIEVSHGIISLDKIELDSVFSYLFEIVMKI